jgi:hypothetical protein
MPAAALDEAGSDQHLDRGREGADDTGDEEQAQPDEEQGFARALIAEPPEGHERETEHQHVAGDDDLQLGRTGAQRLLDRGQRDVHLAQIEDRQRRDGHADPERAPALPAVEEMLAVPGLVIRPRYRSRRAAVLDS